MNRAMVGATEVLELSKEDFNFNLTLGQNLVYVGNGTGQGCQWPQNSDVGAIGNTMRAGLSESRYDPGSITINKIFVYDKIVA